MKPSVLITCFGGSISRGFYEDFKRRGDYRVFFSDANHQCPALGYMPDCLTLPSGNDADFTSALLKKAVHNDIKMIIPSADEEALAIMCDRKKFEEVGIKVAVQDDWTLPYFQSKSAMYDFLESRNFPIPFYKTFKDKQSFEMVLKDSQYPSQPLLIKPNAGRGGRGIYILSEKLIPNKDNLHIVNRDLLEQLIDGKTEFLVMHYLEGIIFDVDVMTYVDGSVFTFPRKRLHNVTKLFSGNIFEDNPKVMAFCEQLYRVFPSKNLIDYDILVTTDGRIELLEINPRPSGSTISYLPYGINMYDILFKSLLENKKIDPGYSFVGKGSFSFHYMVGKDL